MLRKSPIGWAAIFAQTMALFCAPAPLVAGDVSVFAAASLAEALKSAASEFERDSGHQVHLTLAGSSALARQLEYGAPADVFVSANTAWIAHLNDRGVLDQELQSTRFGNQLALIVPVGSKYEETEISAVNFPDLVSDGRMAMALVEAVPAGIYGRQALQKLGVWQAMAPKVAQVDNVRAALSLVALGEASTGIVYLTDAQAEERVRVVALFPPELHDPIVYPAAVVMGRDRPEVLEFMSHLDSKAARAAFEKKGFRYLEAHK